MNLGLLRNRVSGLMHGLRSKSPKTHSFRCNICGADNQCAYSDFGRETASCRGCGSTVRMRSMVQLVSEALFGRNLALPDWPHRPDIRGVGLSDWDGYASQLPKYVNYTNTYYHTDPFLDITNIPDEMAHTCDFIISTDVFEHVLPPVSKAFDGAMRLLKPGGTLVLSVPFATEPTETLEHYPRLHKFEVHKVDGLYELHNTLPSGEVEVHANPIFHGGPGDTLEMRVFAHDSLQAELERAGFTDIRFRGEPVDPFGIHWHYPWSIPVTAKSPR